MKSFASLPEVQKFIGFIEERQSIYLKKEAGEPKPWTDNEFLQKFHFTNVFRDQDKATAWMIENIAKADAPYIDRLFNLAMFHTLQLKVWKEVGIIPYDFTPEKVIKQLIGIHKRTGSIFPRAYLYCPTGGKKFPSLAEKLVRRVWLPLKNVISKVSEAGNLWEVNDLFQTIYSVGPFMANQMTLDANQVLALDDNGYVMLGPGSNTALTFIFSDNPEKHIRDLVEKLKRLRIEHKKRFKERMRQRQIPIPGIIPTIKTTSAGGQTMASITDYRSKKVRTRDWRGHVSLGKGIAMKNAPGHIPATPSMMGLIPKLKPTDKAKPTLEALERYHQGTFRTPRLKPTGIAVGLLVRGVPLVNDKRTMSKTAEKYMKFLMWLRDNQDELLSLDRPLKLFDAEHILCEYWKIRKMEVVGTSAQCRKYPQQNKPTHNIERLVEDV